MNVLDQIEAEQFRKKKLTYDVGDTVDVHVKIKEGEKERIQVFSGVVIKKKGGGLRETFTVRRIVQNQGVERIFPLHSPKIVDIVVTRKGRVRRAKLYYLRNRKGKATRLKEEIGGTPGVKTAASQPEAKVPEAPATPAEGQVAQQPTNAESAKQ